MLAILRILSGFALFAVFGKAVEVAGLNPQTEGTTDAGYVALAVVIGLVNAVLWAPVIGGWLADPLTGAFTSGNPADFTNGLLQFAHKLALRRWRRSALFFAFMEGVRHPDLPGAFVLGMNHARPGSLLQRIFAREVWRFDNAHHCLRAWKVLQDAGVDPGLHRGAEVNLLLLAQQRPVPPPPAVLPVPPAPAAPTPARNERIRLFDGAIPTSPARAAGESPGMAVPAVPAAAAAPAPAAASEPPIPPGEGDVPRATPADPATGSDARSPNENEGPAPGSAPTRPLSLRERWQILITGRLPD